MRSYVCVAGVSMLLGANVDAYADLFNESHLSLGLRNFYVDRDFKQTDAPKSRVGSWSQGFDLQFISGYTPGVVQLGLDLGAQYAYRLEGGAGRAPDSVLPYHHDSGEPVRQYGRAGATLKARYAKTEVKVGEQRPMLPVAYMDDSRQLVTTFQGASFESKEWSQLTLSGGRFWQIATRESSNHEDIYLFGTARSRSSDGLNYAGVRYDFGPNTYGNYFVGQLEDIYLQQYLGVQHRLTFADDYRLKLDARYYSSREEGAALAGDVDNRVLGLMGALSKNGHTVTLAYQRMFGDTAFPLLNGYTPQPYLVNWSTVAFYKTQERSWQARYDYDFAALGLPGLRFVTRYLRGTDINRGAGLSDNTESESNFMLSYAVQSGPLRGLGIEARNINVKTRYGADYVENRLITTYTWSLW